MGRGSDAVLRLYGCTRAATSLAAHVLPERDTDMLVYNTLTHADHVATSGKLEQACQVTKADLYPDLLTWHRQPLEANAIVSRAWCPNMTGSKAAACDQSL